jgi:hypothetical protein
VHCVPQGSVLGPILFIIYINDIHTVCSGDTALLLFADDAKLYSSVTLGNASVSLQHSLDRLVQWANDWQLTINVNKCCVLSITSAAHSPPYFTDGSPLPRQNSYVDLGVTIDSKLPVELDNFSLMFVNSIDGAQSIAYMTPKSKPLRVNAHKLMRKLEFLAGLKNIDLSKITGLCKVKKARYI